MVLVATTYLMGMVLVEGTYLMGMVLVEDMLHPLRVVEGMLHRVVEGTTHHRLVVTAADSSVRDLKHAKHRQ